MIRSVRNTLSLIGISWRVMRREGLMMYPLLAGLSLLALMLYVLVAFEFGGTFERVGHGFNVLPADVIFLGLAYLGSSFVVVYFSAALVASAHYRIDGGAPDLRFGLEAANDRLGAIALWSVVAATIGLAIRQTVSLRGVFGRSGGFFAETAWGRPAFMVVPAMIVEGSPPLEALRRSAEMSRQTWGDRVAAGFNFGPVYAGLLVASLVLGVAVHELGASSGVAIVLTMTVFALAVAWLKCLETILIVALYNYASVGESDGYFPEQALHEAYALRKAHTKAGPATGRRAVT